MKPREPGVIFIVGALIGIVLGSVYMISGASEVWYLSMIYVVGSVIWIIWIGSKINMRVRSGYR